MKNIMKLTLSLLLAGMTTLAPQTSFATEMTPAEKIKNQQNMEDLGTVLLIGAAVALVVVAVDNMPSCGASEHKHCDRYDDHEQCEYQRVESTEIMNQCTQYRRYGSYECVRSETSSTTYIKSCGRSFDRDYNREHRR